MTTLPPGEYSIDLAKLPLGAEPYQRAEVVRASKLGDDFAMTFYQLNYQAIVDYLDPNANPGRAEPNAPQALPVAKVVMSQESVVRLYQLIGELITRAGLRVEGPGTVVKGGKDG